MKYITALPIASALVFASPSYAEAPCDFKAVSVGDKKTAAEIMTTLGVTKYKTNPVRPSFEETLTLAQRYGMIPAAELQDWNIGPYCEETSGRIPYGVQVGNSNTPVKVFVSFHDGLITEINVSFSETYWDEILPVLDQKYGADWKIDRSDTPVTNYETKKTTIREQIAMDHRTNGTNPRTQDHCQISAENRPRIRAPRCIWTISFPGWLLN